MAPKRKKTAKDPENLQLEGPFDSEANLQQFSPISQVPPDILLHIFLELKNCLLNEFRICVQASKSKEPCGWWGRDTEAEFPILEVEKWIVPTSHVCKQWRKISLESPLLWADIQIAVNRHLWAAEMLKRSKNSLITVDVDFRLSPAHEKATKIPWATIETLQISLSRCRQLRLYGVDDTGLKKFFKGVDLSRLELLRVDRSWEKTTMIETLTSSGAPALRRLSLNGQGWKQANLPSLSLLCQITHLRLHDIHPQIALPEFLKLIIDIPALEFLDISNILETADNITMTSPKAALPMLKSLTIFTTYIVDTARFLSSISAPSLTFFKMFAFADVDIHDQVRRYKRALRAISCLSESSEASGSTGEAFDSTIRSIRLLEHKDGNHHFTQAFRGAPLSFDELLKPTIQPAFDITSLCPFDYSGYGTRIDCITEPLFSLFPAENVVTLQVGKLALERSDWRNIMAAMPNLATVFLSGYIEPFFKALVHGHSKLKVNEELLRRTAPILYEDGEEGLDDDEDNESDDGREDYGYRYEKDEEEEEGEEDQSHSDEEYGDSAEDEGIDDPRLKPVKRLRPTGIPLPFLGTICMYNMKVHTVRSLTSSRDPSVAAWILAEVFRVRHKLGTPIKQLTFVNSKLASKFSMREMAYLQASADINILSKKFQNGSLCDILSYVPENEETRIGPELKGDDEFC